MNLSSLKYHYRLATERTAVQRALRVALIVGIVLNLVNHPGLITALSFENLKPGSVLLTFIVPYLVSTYSTVLSNRAFQPGNISRVDALLKCGNCNEADFSIHVGEAIEACPNCRDNTRWKLKKISSEVRSEKDLLKSLALFARHNPQPLFRLNKTGMITGANPAAGALFAREDLGGENIYGIVPELDNIQMNPMLETGTTAEVKIERAGRHFNLLLKGVPLLHMVHVYGSDITDIHDANQKIRTQSEEILKSIHYASMLQKAVLPGRRLIDRLFPSNFVFYRPRDIVSGDFYWARQVGNTSILAVADSTGHGVPGAFMSMLGISLLNDIVLRENILQPDLILNEMRKRLIGLLSSDSGSMSMSDGFDIALVSIDERDQTLGYAGAFNPLLMCRDGSLHIFPADKMPIGKFHGTEQPFTARWDTFKKGDRLFLFSDGYPDQFGGEQDKKYSMGRFKQLIIRTDDLPLQEVSSHLEHEFDQWKRDAQQIDDVLVVGVESI